MPMWGKATRRAKHWHAIIKRSVWRFIAEFLGFAGALAFVRDEFLSQELQARLKMPHWLPAWPWYWWVIAALIGVIFALLEGSYREYRDQEAALRSTKTHHRDAKIDTPPQIDIRFKKRSPYEVTTAEHSRVKSVVCIGLKNSGGGTASNCKVFIDTVSPAVSIPGGLPIHLDTSGFVLRHDDPEKIIEIAAFWNHTDQFRFSSPNDGGWSMAASYIPKQPTRTFVLRVQATECHRNATFRLSVDDSQVPHLEFVSYVNA